MFVLCLCFERDGGGGERRCRRAERERRGLRVRNMMAADNAVKRVEVVEKGTGYRRLRKRWPYDEGGDVG